MDLKQVFDDLVKRNEREDIIITITSNNSLIKIVHPFDTTRTAANIYSYTQDRIYISPMYSSGMRATSYKQGSKGIIKRIDLLIKTLDGLLATKIASEKAAAIAKDAYADRCVHLVEKYGEHFKVMADEDVRLTLGEFNLKVDPDKEVAEVALDAKFAYSSNSVPLHMLIPFLNELRTYNLIAE